MTDREAITKALAMMSDAGELGEGWEYLANREFIGELTGEPDEVEWRSLHCKSGNAIATYAILMGSWWMLNGFWGPTWDMKAKQFRVSIKLGPQSHQVVSGPDPLAALCRARLGVEG